MPTPTKEITLAFQKWLKANHPKEDLGAYGVNKDGIDGIMGAKTKDELAIVRHYRKNVEQGLLDWSVDAILNWKNDWQPPNLLRIHGDADRIFPFRKTQSGFVVKGGTHFMIFSRAKEVNQCLASIAN